MATILEGALWTVTEEVAEHMVTTGLLTKCERNHDGVLEIDRPIYHIACDAPRWFGMSSLPVAIAGAERAIEAEATTNGEKTNEGEQS